MSIDQRLLNALLLILPFDPSDIQEIEENCGTVWITLKSGKVYSIGLIEAEE